MKIKFNYKGVHHCEAVVLSCIDFRFWRESVEFIEKGLGIRSFDFPSVPGSAKAVNESYSIEETVKSCISVPMELHNAKKIVIINHEDCGAYGGSKEFGGDSAKEQSFHEEELRTAKRNILEHFPDKEVILVYARFADDGEAVEFLTIE
ncbi:MAG: hypothetical protein HGB08_01040 [Candidatus Moranbacteria bacterium]|nr:hypothetical protein [Candidatus Moranbacteria bacterium]